MRFPPALCAAVEVPAPGPRGGGTLPGAGVESSAQARDESGPCGEGSHNHDHSNCLCCVCRVFIFKDTGVVSRQHSICIDPSRKISTAHLDAKHGRSSNVTLLRRGSASEPAAGLGAPLYPHTPRPTAGYDSNRSLPPTTFACPGVRPRHRMFLGRTAAAKLQDRCSDAGGSHRSCGCFVVSSPPLWVKIKRETMKSTGTRRLSNNSQSGASGAGPGLARRVMLQVRQRQ